MEEEIGCWFNQVFIACDGCKYGSDVVGCAGFRKEFYAKYGHEKLGHEKQMMGKRASPYV